jgi:hypothetical protein
VTMQDALGLHYFIATCTVSGFKLSLYFSATVANSDCVLGARYGRSQMSVFVTYATVTVFPWLVAMVLIA